MRKFYWYLTSYIKKHGLVFFASIIIAVLVFSFLIPTLSRFMSGKKREYIGLVGDFNLYSLPLPVKQLLSVGLTEINEDKEVMPRLAERWVVEDDGKRYRFILKKDITWQDGKEITPEDIQYQFSDVEMISTPNDIIFKLPDVFAPFPSVVSEPVFRYETQKYLGFLKRTTIIGIGKHRLADYKQKGNRLTEVTIDGPDKRRIFRFYLTETAAVLAFKRGEIDVLPDLTSPHDITTWETVTTTVNLESGRYLAVFFNNADPLLPKNVRQALSYAVEKVQGEMRALGPIDSQSWAFLEGGKSYDLDLERASERLIDGLPPEILELELTTTSVFAEEAEDLKRQWEQFGEQAVSACQGSKDVENRELCNNLKIKINLKITNFPDTSNFQLLLVGQESPPDPDQYFLWHSEQSTNFTRYKNTRIDSLLEKGRKTLDQQERLAVYQEFQQFLLEDPPAIFLRHLYSFEVRRK